MIFGWQGLARACAIVGLVVATGASAAAGKWPVPAAGASASGDPEVVFTFDDGPDEDTTPLILDALAAHRVQAIFFWVGHRVRGDRRGADARRGLVARAVRAGHLVGNHTINHAHLCQGDEADAAREIDDNQGLYATLTGLPMILFRTPYGSRCDRLVEQLEARGLDHFHWDIDPQEFLGKSTEETAAYVTNRLRRLRGRAVILMHDTKRSTAQAVPVILDWIAAENARRRATGARPIRIVDASEVMAERLDHGLATWSIATAERLRGQLAAELDRLVPAAGPRADRAAGSGPDHRPRDDRSPAAAAAATNTR